MYRIKGDAGSQRMNGCWSLGQREKKKKVVGEEPETESEERKKKKWKRQTENVKLQKVEAQRAVILILILILILRPLDQNVETLPRRGQGLRLGFRGNTRHPLGLSQSLAFLIAASHSFKAPCHPETPVATVDSRYEYCTEASQLEALTLQRAPEADRCILRYLVYQVNYACRYIQYFVLPAVHLLTRMSWSENTNCLRRPTFPL